MKRTILAAVAIVAFGTQVRPQEGDPRVIYVDQGRITESGRPQEFFDNPRNERTRAFLSRVLKH